MGYNEVETKTEELENNEVETETEELENNEVETETEELENNETEEVKSKPEPDRFTKRINQKHRELMEERRAREELERRIQQIEQTQKPQRPVIPDIPDPYDSDYDERVKQRDEAIAAASEYDAREKYLAEARQQQQRERQQQESQRLNTLVTDYAGRARKAGIKEPDLQAAGATVAAYGISNDLTTHILEDDQGPLLTMHLARNPDDLERINSMSPLRAAAYIENTIKPKLSNGVRNKVVPPPQTLNGGGVTPSERGPKGARYE